jgi:hypothetical protein
MTSVDNAPEDPLAQGPGEQLGERLASWLEELGLADQLATAGLPTFVRDGRAVTWTDASGEPLPADRLEELDRQLRSQGDDPRHGVPVPLVLLARQARVRAELLASPWLTYETLAAARGATVEATRFAVHKAATEHRLLVVAADERTLVPGFQLTPEGELRPELAGVLEPLLAARMDPWQVWAWLTQPVALLGGQVPERLAADPAEEAVVAHAAARLAERATARP